MEIHDSIKEQFNKMKSIPEPQLIEFDNIDFSIIHSSDGNNFIIILIIRFKLSDEDDYISTLYTIKYVSNKIYI